MIVDAPAMTTEQLLALPPNGTERWLIQGQLREKPMTIRNRFHSRIMVRSAKFLDNWADGQPEPRGKVLCGEVGCRLRRNPDTTYGIDVVYVAANLVQQESDDTTLIDGVPILAVEILSPSDTVDRHDLSQGPGAGAGQHPPGLERRAAPAGLPRRGEGDFRVIISPSASRAPVAKPGRFC
jgi:Uma2 family endonuclease